MDTAFINSYIHKRNTFYKWKDETHFAHKISLAFLFACLTAAGAAVKIYFPFTPVPMTLQVFFVLLGGLVLGKWYGGLAQVLYVGMGAAGIPWFTAQSALLGVTGGYLIGFILAAFLIGWITDKCVQARHFRGLIVVMFLALGVIYACGSFQLSLILRTDLLDTLSLGVFPFFGKDILTIFSVSLIGSVLLPKQKIGVEPFK
jgi:biotin transport system substrate-specific component